MRIFIFGDANVDVSVDWIKAQARFKELSEENQRIIRDSIVSSRTDNVDVEYYLPRGDEQLSKFFNSLKPRVEYGGTAAIKARTMARLGHDVTLYSWVGDDERGSMIMDELSKASVDTSHMLVEGKTCETYNLFDPNEKRVAFSFWEVKRKLEDFIKLIEKEKPDKVLLCGAHRIKTSLGYASLPNAYVFTGSFAAYSEEEMKAKYTSDFSRGVIVGNDAEMTQLSGVEGAINAMNAISNEFIVMHGTEEMAVKRGDELIAEHTLDIDKSKVVEMTGIGDVWESFFLGSLGDLRKTTEKDIRQSIILANKAAVHRMMTGEFPIPESF